MKRLIGVVTGVICLILMLGIGVHEMSFVTFTLVVVATLCVLIPLLIVRCFRVVIHLDSSSAPAAGRIQFSIRHLMILNFLVACLVSIGKLVQPHLSRGHVSFHLLLLALLFGVVGILPVWFTLATKRPTFYGLGLVAVGVGAGYCFGWKAFGDEKLWATATATEAVAVVVSLLVVRSCGYRLVRLPSRHEANKLAGDSVVHSDPP
ncbi:MAG: hypothetical protein ACYC0X_12330 [Pirellulaceae bacterium]